MSFPWWADHADRSLRPIARSPCRLLKLARVRQLPDAPSDRQGMLSTVFGIAGPADEDMRRTLGVFAGPGFYWFSLGLTCLFRQAATHRHRLGIRSRIERRGTSDHPRERRKQDQASKWNAFSVGRSLRQGSLFFSVGREYGQCCADDPNGNRPFPT